MDLKKYEDTMDKSEDLSKKYEISKKEEKIEII